MILLFTTFILHPRSTDLIVQANRQNPAGLLCDQAPPKTDRNLLVFDPGLLPQRLYTPTNGALPVRDGFWTHDSAPAAFAKHRRCPAKQSYAPVLRAGLPPLPVRGAGSTSPP